MDSATPHSDPSGGQAPALHFLVPPSIIGLQFGRLARARAGIEVHWRAQPGSESGTCVSYQSLMPAGAGTPRYETLPDPKAIGSPYIGTLRILATPHPDPRSRGFRAPAVSGYARFARAEPALRLIGVHNPIGVRDMLSYQSLSTPRYGRSCGERIGTADSATPHPDPCGGGATFSHSAIDHRSTIRHVSPVESRHRG